MLVPIVLLSTCTSDQGLAPAHRVEARMDLTGLLAAAGDFPITIDRVEVQLRKHSDPATVVLDTIITGSGIGTSGADLQVTLRVKLDESPEDFDFVAIALAGAIEYFRASGTVTVTDGGTATTPPITPTYTGPGTTADGLTITGTIALGNGEVSTLTGTARQGATVIPGVPVVFESSDSAEILPVSTGINTATITAPATGSGSVTISARTPSGLTQTANVTWAPKPATIVLISGNNQSVQPGAAAALPLVTEVRTSTGAVIPGVTVTFAVASGPTGTSVAPTTAVTTAQGRAQTTLTAGNAAGAIQVTATAQGVATPVTFNATVAPVATALAFTVQPSGTTAGAAIVPAIQVAIRDGSGNTVTSATNAVTLAIGTNPGAGTLSGTRTVNAVAGIATFTGLSINNAGTGYTLTAAATGLTGATSTAFNVGAPLAILHYYPFNTGATDSVGTANGTLVGGATVANGMLTVDGVDGLVQFGSHIVPTSGSYTVALFVKPAAAQAGFIEWISQGSNGGPGFYLGKSSTGTVRASDTWATTTPVAALDGQFHHYALVVDAAATQSRLYVDGALAQTLPQAITTTTGGTDTRLGAQFPGFTEFLNGSIDEVRIYQGAATTGQIAALASPGASALAFLTQPSSAGAGVAIAPAIRVAVVDRVGRTITTDNSTQITLTIGTNPSGGTLSGTRTVTAVAGVATFSGLSINNVGTGYTLQASAGGLTGATSTGFDIGTGATTVAIVSGDNQTGPASTALGQPLVVLVTDALSNPVSGATVTWATGDGGSFAPATGTTNASGNAQTTWTLGPSATTQHATATVGALTPATFTATVGLPAITLSFASIPGVGIGLTATINITLATPAPAGGRAVTLVSGNPSFFTVAPASVTIPSGQTTGTTVVTGVAAGTANLTASATGYTDGVLPVTVQNRSISVPPTLNVPYGQTASMPIQLPAPAPAGGVTFTVISGTPGNVSVQSSPVTIAAGTQTANATLNGVLPGPATITVHNAAYIDGVTAANTSAALDISQTSVNPNGSFGQPITINFESNNVATAAPAPGITVSFISRDSTCALATAPVTIPTGLTNVTSTVSYGGGATLPCNTRIVATAPNLTTDSVSVTVSPVPAITLANVTVGSGLQINTQFNLGASNHGGVTVTLTSANNAVLLAPDAVTPGATSITVPVANGIGAVGYYVQGAEGRTTDTVTSVITASATGFSNGTATMTAVEGAIDLQGLPATTTTLSPANPIYFRLGIATAGYGQLAQLQALRAGAPASLVGTFTSGTPAVGNILKKNTAAAASQTALLLATQFNTPGDTTSGGVAFHPLASGSSSVTVTAPGFVSTPFATRSVTVSQPTISASPVTVGSGLQINTSFNLGASAHGNITVAVKSLNPAVLVSPNVSTPGVDSIGIAVLDGTTGVGYYVQGLEGRTTDTVQAPIVISAPGFADDTVIITSVEGATDLQGLPSTTTTLTPSSIVYVRLGIANSGYSSLAQLQSLRAGAPASALATFTTPAGGVGNLLKAATAPGLSQTALIAALQDNTPTDTTSGGVVFHPLSAGSTSVSASVAGFVPTTGQSTRNITVSQPATNISALTVGSGLQINTAWSLGASAHGPVTVRLVSSNPAILLAPNATTPGVDSLDIPIVDGVTSGGYYVQGVEGHATDTVTSAVVIKVPGFSDDTVVMTLVPAQMDLQGLPGTTTTLSPSSIAYARLGIGNGAQLFQLQNLRAGGPGPMTVTFTTPANGIGELLKAGIGSSTTQTAQIPALGNNTPTDTTSGGVVFHPLLSGTTTVSATAPGVVSTTSATRSITSSQPAVTVASTTVGSGLQTNNNWNLGAPNHGAIDVTITSSNPAMLVSPNATTPGSSSITVPIADGVTTGGFYVQGLEGQTGSTTVTVSAPGFTNGTGTIIVAQPAIDLQGLPSSTTPLTPSNPIYARIGIGNSSGLSQLQTLRAGGAGSITFTFTTPSNGLGNLLKAATPAATTQTAVLTGTSITNTPTDTTTGGVAFHPLANGTTSVTVTAPGFLSTNAATRSITVVAPTISVNTVTVGSGLQVSNNLQLSAPNHGAINVTITGSDPAILLAPDATTPGQTSITIPVADGVQNVSFYVAGVEGRTSGLTGTITVSAPGFVDGVASASVLQAAIDLIGVPTTMAAGAADLGIYARVGTASSPFVSLNTVQNVRAGIPGGGLTITFTSSNPGAASLLTSASPGGATQTAFIPIGSSNTPSTIATGGVGLHNAGPGSSSISVSAPNILTTGNGTDPVTTQ